MTVIRKAALSTRTKLLNKRLGMMTLPYGSLHHGGETLPSWSNASVVVWSFPAVAVYSKNAKALPLVCAHYKTVDAHHDPDCKKRSIELGGASLLRDEVQGNGEDG